MTYYIEYVLLSRLFYFYTENWRSLSNLYLNPLARKLGSNECCYWFISIYINIICITCHTLQTVIALQLTHNWNVNFSNIFYNVQK
jgi:hypothetical protein